MTDGAVAPAQEARGDAAPRMPGLRVCVVGDALVAGVGDARSLGWVGRVGARTPRDEGPVTMFPLGVPGETTAALLTRWREETNRRFAGAPAELCRLITGLMEQ